MTTPILPTLAGPGRWRTLLRAGRDRLGLMTQLAGERDAMRFRMGPKTLYFFNHPDHARHVLRANNANYLKGIGLVESQRALGNGLLTSEGDLWQRQRRVVQPLFSGDRIAGLTGAVADEADSLVRRWKRGGGQVDVVREMTAFTLGVLGRVLLDTDLRPYAGIEPAFAAVQEQAMFEMVTLGKVPHWVPLPGTLRFRRARRELEHTVAALTAAREHDRGDDLVSRLLDARDADPDPDPRAARRRLRDELVTLLLAGHETTSSTLAWTWLLVAQHPEVGDRLRDEACRVLGGRPVGRDELRDLTYTTAVIEEVMRLYPPVWILPRRAVAADEIGGTRVPAGADVLICPYTLHRNPGFWPNPDEFDPERFTSRDPDRHRYAYLPFGAGPRACVGSTLGMLEAAVCVATVIQHFRPVAVEGYRPHAQAMLSLRVRGSLPMLLTDLAGDKR